MSVSSLIADMVRAGVDPDLIGRAAELLAAREVVEMRDEQAERRRAADRERKAFRRIPQNSADTPSLEVLEVSPVPPSKSPNPSPKKTPKGVQKGGSSDGENLLIAEGVSPQALADWSAVRKAKKAGPITITGATQLIREAEKAGISPAEAVEFAASRSWQGFFADWYSNSQPRQGRAPPLFSSEPTGIAAVIHHLEARTR